MGPRDFPDSLHKFDLSGRRALVTGGATGIGYNIARALAGAGAKVMIAARREDVLRESAERLSDDTGNKVIYQTLDLADTLNLERFAGQALDTLGSIDILVGNAAQDAIQSLENITIDITARLLQVNLAANIHLFRAVLPGMRAGKWGRVIFSSSVTSICGADSVSVYSATKAGLNAFARAAAVEVGRDGITVNTLVFGFFSTEMILEACAMRDEQDGSGSGQKMLDDFSSMTAIGRPCRCDEVEGVIQLLASDAGSAITGTNLIIDGGMSIMLRPKSL